MTELMDLMEIETVDQEVKKVLVDQAKAGVVREVCVNTHPMLLLLLLTGPRCSLDQKRMLV